MGRSDDPVVFFNPVEVEYDTIFEAKIREKCERGRSVPSKPY